MTIEASAKKARNAINRAQYALIAADIAARLAVAELEAAKTRLGVLLDDEDEQFQAIIRLREDEREDE